MKYLQSIYGTYDIIAAPIMIISIANPIKAISSNSSRRFKTISACTASQKRPAWTGVSPYPQAHRDIRRDSL